MTLEEIKNRHKHRLGNDTYIQEITWIIAEVEKWQNRFTPIDEWTKKKYEFIVMEQLLENPEEAASNIMKLVIDQCLCEQHTAERCAKIIENKITTCKYAQVCAKAIREEFNLAE